MDTFFLCRKKEYEGTEHPPCSVPLSQCPLNLKTKKDHGVRTEDSRTQVGVGLSAELCSQEDPV